MWQWGSKSTRALALPEWLLLRAWDVHDGDGGKQYLQAEGLACAYTAGHRGAHRASALYMTFSARLHMLLNHTGIPLQSDPIVFHIQKGVSENSPEMPI